ncbi:EamA family transporter [Schumannella sp. 10F1B-5-1]|uniref:EamA family transporter n=1 Tax=Schumannella sp. 10F1B-5-1 TaxID=2590780 RepID=UPI001130DF64|nr:EamA family transporter [Schumannella sp. 10F1B-5-1]TPW70183.1 EamA family transporter [Schumannella sp. 10F1B-5-1]
MSIIAITALAPTLWGTTYFVTSTFLPAGHPLLIATMRALPAGLILLVFARRLPYGAWWWRSLVLGALNIAAFFACLFIAAGRLPGGVAAVVGGIQPILVAVLASRLLGERLSRRVIVSGAAGVVGVALIVLRPAAALDAVGVVAALLGASSMALGVVLSKRWAGEVPPLVSTSWQLVAGGLMLAVIAALAEPLPKLHLEPGTVLGFAYLTVAGTAFAYVIWFRGLAALPARAPSFLGLLSPIVALAIGISIAGERLVAAQGFGVALVVGAIGVAVSGRARRARRADGGGLASP